MSETCDRCVNRRSVLRGAALAGVAGVLAACGQTQNDPSGAGRPAGSPTEADPPTAEDTGNGGGMALASTNDIPVGGGAIFEDQQVVVTQPERGTFAAFSAVCTHQGCIVASVKKGVISCDCHGSQFDAATGEVVSPPATQPLPEVPITVEGGQIHLA